MQKMPRYILPYLFIILLFSLVGCSSDNTTKTLDAADSLETPVSGVKAGQDCDLNHGTDLISEAESDWTWHDITVGVSTKEELISELGEPLSIDPWHSQDRQVTLCIYHYGHLPDNPRFYVGHNKVIGIEFSKLNRSPFETQALPSTLDEAQDLYGRADLVGWSTISDPNFRSVIWSAHGVQAEVAIASSNWIHSILYFAPIDNQTSMDTIWLELVLLEAPEQTTDHITIYPRDPFDWK